MIHFVTWIPLPYQQALCRVLREHYGADFMVWYGESRHREFPFKEVRDDDFPERYLDECGYLELARHLFRDKKSVVILGGWSSPMSSRVLLLTTLLRRPVLLWADHPHPRVRNPLVSLARGTYFRLLDKVVSAFLAAGEPTVRHLVSLGFSREKITAFPYWTDLPSSWNLSPGSETSSLRSEPLRLIAIGRLASVKRFDVAINAVASVNKIAGYPQAELLIVGAGSERSSLAELAASSGCSDHVKFAGWLEPDAVQSAIENADALIIPSSFEPYGVVVLEAMAAGRPVLASEGVIAAIDRDEGTGAVLFHPVGDVKALANHIAWLAVNRDQLRKASLAARATAEKWPPTRAIEILNEVISGTKAGKKLIDGRTALPIFH